MSESLTAAQMQRIIRLPKQIDGTFAKLERLLTTAETVGYRPRDWAGHLECLRSRFLTDPHLINEAWDRAERPEQGDEHGR